MTDPDVTEGLRSFIRECVPNVDAIELLLAMAEHPERKFGIRDLFTKIRGTDAPEAMLRKYLASFERCGAISQQDGGYRFAPANSDMASIVQALARLYTERPVTLVRLIYALREERIRAFADAFKLKKS
jgi:DNA-binding IclR family transcriptional regulator